MSWIDKLLSKRGIKNEEDLSIEERQTLQKYRSILSGEKISVENIKTFCQAQVNLIQTKFADNPRIDDDVYLKACLHVYLNIIKAIEAPELEREILEKHLEQLVKE